MTTLVEVLHAAARSETDTTLNFEGDLHALFTANAISEGQFSERLLAYAQSLEPSIETAAAAFNYLLLNDVVAPPTEVPENSTPPVINEATLRVGDSPTWAQGTWTNGPITARVYELYADAVLIGGGPYTSGAYELTESEEGANITVGEVATNVIGDSNEEISAAVGPVLPEVPSTISDLTATAQSDTEILLEFTPATPADTHEYRIDGGTWVECDDNTGSQLVSGLTAETEYDFEVRATNGGENGAASNVATETTEAEPAFAITTPVLTDIGSVPGDFTPSYNIDGVDAYPDGMATVGETLEGRWGISEGAAEALTPVEAVTDEGWWIDGDDPFPDFTTFCEAQSPGATVYFQIRVNRDPAFSDWSAFLSWLIKDGTMDAPGLTDLTDQTVSTRVWSSSFVANMTNDPTAQAKLVGTGPIEVDDGGGPVVYEAGETVVVADGDDVRFGVDTSSSGAAQVDNVVTNRGAALETFSATTAGAAATATHKLTEILDAYNFGGGTQSSASGFSINDGDKLVLHLAWRPNGNNPPTGITATHSGGTINFTQIGTRDEHPSFYTSSSTWYADTSGVTDIDSIDLVASGSTKNGAFVCWAVTGAPSGAPTDSYREFRDVTNENPHDVDGSLSAPTDGVMLCSVTYFGTNRAINWTGATEVSEVNNSGTDNDTEISGAIQTTAAAVTIAGQAGGGPAYTGLLIAVTTWEPA